MVEEQVEENHKHSLWNLYSVRPIFKGNKICSRKNSVHIIFVSVPSVERTLLFRRYSLVPRPVRAIRVTRGGLEPSAIGEFSRQA